MNLRVNANRFRRELLRGQGAIIGCYDGRLSGKERTLGRNDPSFAAVRGPFMEAMNSYLPGALKYKSSLKYEISNAPVRPWNYSEAATNRYLNVAPRLRSAMQKNRSIRVFVASGYHDLTTPFAATQYTFAHLGTQTLTDRVTMAYYQAGHMMYTHKPSLKKLKTDIARFMGGRNERSVPLE
jgi:carboxypeptidase C (cathepsin A)